MDRDVAGRRQNRNVTNSSKGLLPQLVEVLYALADSQERLTNRIRTAHLELRGVLPPRRAESSRTRPVDREVPAELVHNDSVPNPARDLCEQLVLPASGLSIEKSGRLTDSASNVGVDKSTLRLDDPDPILKTPPNLSTETETFDDDPAHNATAIQLDNSPASRRDEKFSGPHGRSYNYFDELDARLADLGNIENGSDATEG